MAENAPINIARPYVVIMTPTRELCTQVISTAIQLFRRFSISLKIKRIVRQKIVYVDNKMIFIWFHIRFTMKHENSHKAASSSVVKFMVEQLLVLKTRIST